MEIRTAILHVCTIVVQLPRGHIHELRHDALQPQIVGDFGGRHMEQTNDNDTAWWDIRKSANYLGVSVGFLRKQVRLKTIPFARAGSKVLRFRRSDLDGWMKSN